jgi:hypothetical protein
VRGRKKIEKKGRDEKKEQRKIKKHNTFFTKI